jgi:predicted phosphodiesterase
MIMAYHGSPKSFYDSITATTPDETLETYFSGLHADVCMGGHTHEQFLRRFGTSRVINPGSVGLPFNLKAHVTPTLARVEYAILEVLSTEPNLTFRRIPYDFTRLKRAAQNSGMPHWQQ